MQAAIRPMIFVAAAVWVLSAALIAILWRTRVPRGVYAWLYVGIFAPLQIALYFASTNRDSIQQEYEERQP